MEQLDFLSSWRTPFVGSRNWFPRCELICSTFSCKVSAVVNFLEATSRNKANLPESKRCWGLFGKDVWEEWVCLRYASIYCMQSTYRVSTTLQNWELHSLLLPLWSSTRLRPSLVVLAPLLSHKMFKHESESPWVKFTCHHDGMVVFPRFINACSAVRLAPLPSRISWPSCRYIYIYMTTHGVLQWSCTARIRPTKPPKRQKTKLVARTCACPGVQRFHQRAPCTQSAHGQDWFSVGHGQRPISWHSSPWSLATHFAK